MLSWIILAIVVLWVINNPHHAADMVQKTGDALSTLVHLH
jgi:hypothetical protein